LYYCYDYCYYASSTSYNLVVILLLAGKLLHTTRSSDKNQIFALDYKLDGSQFVSAGKEEGR